ncbi:tol-pal system-associated acyl-CoA thioesterase [Psychrobium sp. 1_MG-2023]|uniref:tol-pal system-associated acyl-CoA thioesterase n=1 Tax=Psychrobium sp. 1_MG-2023 TaxID=3062624 RepID=UPI000C337103|nr:tol-pal system-associated acyl-CoA thioesterase [Psychrobium sp. 1_MG-2023]MDP2560250.1 tol-pal system-associated acyl-CoA thioesterase [Psychrobium sp. 1_MG-2023]PKF57060.1 tol-pal system-associated acyl-CoA thioesterase [Alteromonadales bacterium alter-6D02]
MSFEFPVRVYYEDTDAGGVVYHSNYLNFFERARTEFLRDLGFEQDTLLAQGIAFVVRRCEIDYLMAAKFNDALTVTVGIKQLKNTSIEFEQKIVSSSGNLHSVATVIVVCVDMKKMKPTRIPANIIEELKSDS